MNIINTVINTLFIAFLTTSCTMSAVILLVLLLNRLLMNRVPAVFQYYMWLIVLIGLLVPFRPDIPDFFSPPLLSALLESLHVSDITLEEGAQNETPYQSQADAPVTTDAVAAGQPAAAVASVQKHAVPYTFILFGLWGMGVLAVLIFHLHTYVNFISAVRRWGADSQDRRAYSLMKAIQDDIGLTTKKRIKVKICRLVSGPMLVGFFEPVILLPEKPISMDELEHIFRHELTHYKRGDLLMNVLVLFVFALHWFNPFVHLMKRAVRADCEAACDEAALAGNDKDRRRQYGETIIGFVGAKNKKGPVLSTYFYGGSNHMKKRLTSIMNTDRRNKWLALFCVVTVVLATLVSGAIITAANNTQRNTPQNAPQYIGEAKARSIALTHAGISEQQATFIKTRLDYEDRLVVYDVEFYSGYTEYDYEIDAVNGSIREYDQDIEYYTVSQAPTASKNAQTASSSAPSYIGEARAKAIALEHAGITEQQTTFTKAYLDYDDGDVVYDVSFYSGEMEYDYEVDAVNGGIREYDRDIEYYVPPSNPSAAANSTSNNTVNGTVGSITPYIDAAKAKSAALANAGLTEQQVTFTKALLDYDDGHIVYDVDFYSGQTEYDYEIDAISGQILGQDRDIEYYSASSASFNANYIGETRAKAIAFENTGLSEAQVTVIKAALDSDDGTVVYDIEFYSGNAEYDYEIDAVSGHIREHDSEIEYYTVPVAAQPSAVGNTPIQATPQPVSSNINTGGYIGEAKAKSIALSAANLSESQVSRIQISLDREHGKAVYEIDFKSGRMEYEYEIDATSGAILQSDVERDD